MQLDRGFTTLQVEQDIAAYYRPDNLTSAAPRFNATSDSPPSFTAIDTHSFDFKHKDVQLVALAYWDCIVSVLALLAAVAALVLQRHMAETTDINTITIADYTIHVTGLPQSANAEQARPSFY
jgi:hypothetical protein